MRNRTARATLMVTLLIGVSLSRSEAQAQSQDQNGQGATRAECSLSFPSHIPKGLGMTPTTGVFNSAGETGSINCEGTLYGHTVTGPGSFGFEGTLTDSSCLSHQGSGIYYFTVPTDAGPLHVSGGGFAISGTGVFGKVDATHPGVHFTGSYVLLLAKGNCVTEPVTEAGVLMQGSVSDIHMSHAFKCDLDAAIVKVSCRSKR
jgi:hypothetical protein